MSTHEQLTPFLRQDSEPAFDEAWQAEVLAIADSLIAAGVVAQSDWSDALGAALRDVQGGTGDYGASNFYQAALRSLEALVGAECGISMDRLNAQKQDWIDAYTRTPHGQPVMLEPK